MCFSLLWLVQTFVWLVVICAIVAIIRLLLPYALSMLGVGGEILMKVINIIVIAVVLIAVAWLCYDLLVCAGVMGPRLR